MDAAAQRQPHAVPLTAVDGQHVQAGQVSGVPLESLRDLGRELAGGREHQACGFFCLRSMRERIGTANAAVLPVPVWARPTTWRPSSSGGIVAAWIGEGVS